MYCYIHLGILTSVFSLIYIILHVVCSLIYRAHLIGDTDINLAGDNVRMNEMWKGIYVCVTFNCVRKLNLSPHPFIHEPIGQLPHR